MLSRKSYPDLGVLDNSEMYYMPPTRFAEASLFCLHHIGIFHCNEIYKVERDNFFDTFMALIIDSGGFELCYMGETTVVNPGSIVLIDCKIPHMYRALGNLSYRFFHFHGNSSQDYFDLLYEMCGVVFKVENRRNIDDTFDELYKLVRAPVFNEHRSSVLIHTFLCELFSSITPYSISYDETIYKVLNYIENNYQAALSINEIAKYVGMSESHLCYLFKKHTGNTIHQYIINIRVHIARKMLLTTQLNLQEIAADCGFGASPQLIRNFKRNMGMTPNEFRKLQR